MTTFTPQPVDPRAETPKAPSRAEEAVELERTTARTWLVVRLVVVGVVVVPVGLAVLMSGPAKDATDPAPARAQTASAAVDNLYRAVDEASCETFTDATTTKFRADNALTTCAAFAEWFGGGPAFEVSRQVEVSASQVRIEGDGVWPDETGMHAAVITYVVVRIGNGWAIDAVEVEPVEAGVELDEPGQTTGATAAVEEFYAAYEAGSCERFVAVTTERFRAFYAMTTCEAFADDAALREGFGEGTITIGPEVAVSGASVDIEVTEAWGDAATGFVMRMRHTLVQVGDGWARDATVPLPEADDVAADSSTDGPTVVGIGDDPPAGVEPGSPVAVVVDFFLAYTGGDCGAFMVTTTPALRQQLAMDTCAAFDERRGTYGAYGDYRMRVEDAAAAGERYRVSTLEYWSGGLAGTGSLGFDYVLVRGDAGWLVDDLTIGELTSSH